MELPNIDTLYTNDEMRNMHSVSTQGGMRKSNETKSLVLITSLESTYTDRQEKDILHYTGEGLNGDQLLNRQNKTLYESNKNGITVWLYEKIEKNNYSFLGKVELADKPYQEQQPDEAGKLRKVWMFPLKASTPVKPIVPKSLIDKVAEKKFRRASPPQLEMNFCRPIRIASSSHPQSIPFHSICRAPSPRKKKH